jgi:predicted nuclease of predicted toxin-antitoxin system
LIDPFLIDECLTPKLAAIARERGHEADHVAHIGMQSAKDWALMPFIEKQNYIFITSNRDDFLNLYSSQGYHNGLIIISCDGKDRQIEVFSSVLDKIEEDKLDDLMNILIEVDGNGIIDIKDWPSS